MALLDAMLPLLEAPVAAGQSYEHVYLDLAGRLTDWARTATAPLWGDELRQWTDATAGTMEAWVHACRQLDPVAASGPQTDQTSGYHAASVTEPD
jgi:hypothetical protein